MRKKGGTWTSFLGGERGVRRLPGNGKKTVQPTVMVMGGKKREGPMKKSLGKKEKGNVGKVRAGKGGGECDHVAVACCDGKRGKEGGGRLPEGGEYLT